MLFRSGVSFANTSLSDNTTYRFKVYSYNGSGSTIAYYTTSPLSGSQASSSVSAPTASAASGLAYSSFTANWSAATCANNYSLYISSATPDTVAAWTFPTSGISTYTDSTASAGTPNYGNNNFSISSGSLSDASGVTTRASSATTWTASPTKYFQVIVNTTNYTNLTLSFAQLSSGSGPGNFRAEYSTNSGTTWTAISGGSYSMRGTYSGTNYSGIFTTVSNLALPTECNNLSSLYVRWIPTSTLRADTVTGGAIASAGTSRLDDIYFKGNLISNVSGYYPATVTGTSKIGRAHV